MPHHWGIFQGYKNGRTSINSLLDSTGGRMGRITFNCKQAISIIFSIALIMMPFNAARAASLGGWSLGGGVAQGASTVYNGSKEIILNGAKKLATGTAKITPAATDVAKLLGKGGGGLALSVAVEQLIGAVGWVLDPANNQIKYHTGDGLTPPDSCSATYLLKYDNQSVTTSQAIKKLKTQQKHVFQIALHVILLQLNQLLATLVASLLITILNGVHLSVVLAPYILMAVTV